MTSQNQPQTASAQWGADFFGTINVATADVAGPVGGTTYTGQGYLNSGLMLPGQGFVVRIDAPPGTYEYICIIHVALGMRGTITVTE